MAVDLTGGIDPSREYVFAQRPDDPEMRDSVSFWVVDDRGEVGLPRIGIEAVGANWDAHDIQVNVGIPRRPRLPAAHQRAVTGHPRARRTGHRARRRRLGVSVRRAVRYLDDDVRRTRRCRRPRPTWSPAERTARLVDISFHVEAKMAVPPWVQGALQADADTAAAHLDRR